MLVFLRKHRRLFLIAIACVAVVSCLFFEIYDPIREKKDSEIELVVSRYNEDLSWLNKPPFNKHPVVCYNKGNNDNFLIKNKNSRIVRLKNVGKCDHTYLYHIIENYDNLADISFFLPGSANMDYKFGKATKILRQLKKDKRSTLICTYFKDVRKKFYDFKIDTHRTAYKANFVEQLGNSVERSEIRPFGKWFESKFGDLTIHHLSLWGIMAISKEHILQHPKQYYIDLIKEVENGPSPEVGHYMERSWEAIFYPMTGANFIHSSKEKHFIFPSKEKH